MPDGGEVSTWRSGNPSSDVRKNRAGFGEVAARANLYRLGAVLLGDSQVRVEFFIVGVLLDPIVQGFHFPYLRWARLSST